LQALAERSVTGRPPIPAMTTDAERECYYRLAKDAAGKGAIVEFGAWLGASTAYIAAGVRDSGVAAKAHVYDQFVSKTGHIEKVKAFYAKENIDKAPVGPSLEAFKDNLGELNEFVIPHQGKIEQMEWGDEPIALMITDAPKRVPAISSVLSKLRKSLVPGSIMAWQDFCHFPSYEIPACLYRLRDHIEFVEAVVPGTTLVFRVTKPWSHTEVSMAALDLGVWSPEEIDEAWIYWTAHVPLEKLALFRCGRAMFLCDLGFHDEAVPVLSGLHDIESVQTKWRYLKANRPDFRVRYAPLFAYLENVGAI
jgi:predicted O-methyltransferase YrrM